MDATWFNLPDGSTAETLELTVPVKGRVKIHAEVAASINRLQDLMVEKGKTQSCLHWGPLDQMLSGVLNGYERTAADALEGARQLRDDVLIYLRSVVFVIETATNDHVSHAEKNARLRGVLSVLERHIASLRDERFNFADSCWRRAPDVFRWDGPERRLREQLDQLRAENSELRSMADARGEGV